jgi:serine/threonine protein kinase
MRLDRTVAIKVLPSEVAGDPDLRARFEREPRAVAALDHPHICGIYDVGSVDGTHYRVMPHLDGQTLAARLEKGPLPLDQALKIAVADRGTAGKNLRRACRYVYRLDARCSLRGER